MSRIGRKPIAVPGNVKVQLQGRKVRVEGPKGKLELDVHPRIQVAVDNNEVKIQRKTDINKDRALHGLTRSLIFNMIAGAANGYTKELDLEGVGYKAQVKGKILNLSLGYTHPIDYEIPAGVEVKCAAPTKIVITGADKRIVGQVAAEIRRFHPPEPYKGKGVRYSDEHVRRKQGKKVG